LFRMKQNSGLSIAEIMVACGLLGIVLVTVMTLFGQLIKNTTKNAQVSAGSFFADKVMETAIQQAQEVHGAKFDNSGDAFDISGFTGGGGTYVREGAEELSIDSNQSKTEYLYRVEAEHLDGFSTNDPGQLWKISVDVRWWQDSTAGAPAARAGAGKLNVERSRVVYIGADRT